MQSPLNISETVTRYGLNEDIALKQQIIAFDRYIWQDCQIDSVEGLANYEKGYQDKSNAIGFCYDIEINGFTSVFMYDGEMTLLEKGAFQRSAKCKGALHTKFIEAGLSELETVVVKTFLAEISGLYRKDAYNFGIPPFVQAVCDILNCALTKLPAYTETVVRACNDYDKADFEIGDIFTPGFCLTCSADLTWENNSENRYKIKPLDAEHTKARNLFSIHNISEKQVTFLQDACFRITGISDWGEGRKQVEMEEFLRQ